MRRLKIIWKGHRRLSVGLIATITLGVIAAVLVATRPGRAATQIPTAEAKLGEFVDRVELRGEIQALRSIVLTAPSSAGDIQILTLVKNGTNAKKDDVIAQFDTTQLQRRLDQSRSELRTAEREIERVRAQGRLTDEANQTELVKARYDVERARLETTKQEILSKIEGEKNRLTLDNTEQKLREIEGKVQSDRAAAEANVEIQRQKREKSLTDVRRDEANLARLTVRAPADGLVTLLQNYRARSGFSGSAPEFKAGDRAWPGAAIAELPDLTTVRFTARVEESDRGRMISGQTVTIRVDAIPDKEFTGKIAEISTLAKLDYSSWPPQKKFNIIIQLEETDARLRPGMSSTARVAVERLPNSVLIPAEASFQRSGRTVVYVVRGALWGNPFEEREIHVGRRGDGQLVVTQGLKVGERIALKDPAAEEGRGST